MKNLKPLITFALCLTLFFSISSSFAGTIVAPKHGNNGAISRSAGPRYDRHLTLWQAWIGIWGF